MLDLNDDMLSGLYCVQVMNSLSINTEYFLYYSYGRVSVFVSNSESSEGVIFLCFEMAKN